MNGRNVPFDRQIPSKLRTGSSASPQDDGAHCARIFPNPYDVVEVRSFYTPELNVSQAEVGNVIVTRHENDRRCGYCLDLKPALRGGPIRPFHLEPEDVVYVPRTRITEIGQWVDQHINNLLPKTGLAASSTSGNTTVGYDLR